MTEVSRNSRTSLPTSTFEDKYFYLTNRIYSNYSNYIYICLEDNNFSLNYNNIKYCFTNTNPSDYPDITVKSCSFISISYYSSQSSSDTIKYYYKFSNTSFYTYSIVYYEGKNSFGNLYVTIDYKNISSDDNKDDDKDDNKIISTVAIIGIVSGSIAILVTFIMIIYCYFKCCGKNKIDIIADHSNQPENLLPNDNPNIQ